MHVSLANNLISKLPECKPSCEAVSEQKAKISDSFSSPNRLENWLWVKWLALLSLVLSALAGWLLLALNNRFAKWIILITTLLLTLSNVFFYYKSYLGIFYLAVGSSMHLLQFQMFASSLFYLLFLPVSLTLSTIWVFVNLTHPSSGTGENKHL